MQSNASEGLIIYSVEKVSERSHEIFYINSSQTQGLLRLCSRRKIKGQVSQYQCFICLAMVSTCPSKKHVQACGMNKMLLCVALHVDRGLSSIPWTGVVILHVLDESPVSVY